MFLYVIIHNIRRYATCYRIYLTCPTVTPLVSWLLEIQLTCPEEFLKSLRGISISILRAFYRETPASRHHRGIIKDPPETLAKISVVWCQVVVGGPQMWPHYAGTCEKKNAESSILA